MNWLEEMIARAKMATGMGEYATPGYTKNQRFDGGGPMYPSGQDPEQYNVPYRAPYGQGQMLQNDDIGRDVGPFYNPLKGRPGLMDYEWVLGYGLNNDTGAPVGMEEVNRDIQGRASSVYPGIELSGRDANMAESRAGVSAADRVVSPKAQIIRALLREYAEMSARKNQAKNRGGKE